MSRRIALVYRRILGLSGTTRTLLEHSRRLTEEGWEVHVFGGVFDQQRLAAVAGESHKLFFWPWGSYLKRWSFAKSFDWILERKTFDIIHGHGDTLTQDVLSLHNCVHAAYESIYRKSLPSKSAVGQIHAKQLRENRFKMLIANSHLMKEDVCQRFSVPSSKIRVIYPGHDSNRFNKEKKEYFRKAIREEWGIHEGEIIIGLITSGDFKKRGVPLFIEALGRLGRELKLKLRVFIVGKEQKLSSYRLLLRQIGWADRVTFLNPIAEVERLYHGLDVYIHPALYEEFGQSVQEALACGVAVLTNRQVGASELMTGPLEELLSDRESVGHIYNGLRTLLANPSLRQEMAKKGPECVRHNSWEKNFNLTKECYEEVLDGK